MQVTDSELAPAPGEQYIKALWRGRWLFLLIVAGFVALSGLITLVLPRWYSSEVILSVRLAPRLEPAAPLYPSAIVSNPSFSTEDEQGARRFVRRLKGNNLVTLAARDAGVIEPAGMLDERQINGWVVVDGVEKTDLVTIVVQQPTAERAQKFATALVTRAVDANRSEATTDPATRKMLEQELHKAEATMTAAETALTQVAAGAGVAHDNAVDRAKLELSLARGQYSDVRKRLGMLDLIVANQQYLLTVVDPPTFPVRPSFPRPLLNISVGLILGILAATTFISLRSVLQGA